MEVTFANLTVCMVFVPYVTAASKRWSPRT